MSESFESTRAPEPVGAFPHAKRVGELLFLSGIGPRQRGSKEIPGVTLDSAGNVISYDIETQCRAVFENVCLVLEDAGATWQDIVDVTVFLTNMKKDFPIYNRVYAEYFAGRGKPNPTLRAAVNRIRPAPRLRWARCQRPLPSSSRSSQPWDKIVILNREDGEGSHSADNRHAS